MLYLHIPGLTEHHGPGRLASVNRPGFLVSPKPENHGNFLAAKLVKMLIAGFLIVSGNQVRVHAVLFRQVLHVVNQHPFFNQNVRL